MKKDLCILTHIPLIVFDLSLAPLTDERCSYLGFPVIKKRIRE
jgi:hypothetical protein